jgi:peptide/nickel transport system substrate-binding protein
MKKRLPALLALLLALCALAGCSGQGMTWLRNTFQPKDEKTKAQEQAAQSVQSSQASSSQGRVTAVTDAAPEKLTSFGLAYQTDYGLHPYNCKSLNNRVILSFLYEPLFAVSDKYEAVPVLAESWQVSADGKTTTVKLRSGVTFHDGTPLTAADAAYSLNASRNSDYYGTRLWRVTSITAPDDATLVLTTNTAYECLPLLLDIPIIKDGSVQDANPEGTGPYTLEGDSLVRWKSWQGSAEPLADFDTIKLVQCDTASDIRDSFEYGDANLVETDPNSLAYVGFHNDYELWNGPTTILQYIGYNHTTSIFGNYGLRSAVTYAVDRDKITADCMGGFGQAAVLPCSPQTSYYDGQLAAKYGFSMTNCYAALQSAGIKDADGDGVLDIYAEGLGYSVPVEGKMIVCSDSRSRVQAAQTVVDALNGAGFKLTLQELDYDEYHAALREGNFDLYYGEVRLPPNFDLCSFFTDNGSLNYGGLADDTFVDLCKQALANNGNTYDLYKRICERGSITPVLVKTYAVYTTRGALQSPVGYVDWFLPAAAAAGTDTAASAAGSSSAGTSAAATTG